MTSIKNIQEWFMVSGDSGKGNTKLTAKLEDGKFITTSFPTTYKLDETADGKFNVNYQSNRYVVGDPTDVANSNHTELSKANEIHKICMLTGVCDLIKKSGRKDIEGVHLAVNMVLPLYLDTKQREAVKKLYEQPEYIEITVDGVDYSFYLKTTIYFESMGVALSNSDKLGTEEVIVFNLGSYNVTGVTFGVNKKPVGSRSFTEELGCRGLITTIQNKLLPVVGRTLPVDTVMSIIMKKKSKVPREAFEVAETEVLSHLNNIKTRFDLLGVDTKYSQLIFSGGGALLLKEYIPTVFGDDVIFDEDPLYGDCKGMLKLLGAKNRK